MDEYPVARSKTWSCGYLAEEVLIIGDADNSVDTQWPWANLGSTLGTLEVRRLSKDAFKVNRRHGGTMAVIL